jgi:FkbM family methyltransferase
MSRCARKDACVTCRGKDLAHGEIVNMSNSIEMTEWCRTVDVSKLPAPRVLNWMYRRIVRLTHMHGFHTLGRMNAWLFPHGERLPLSIGCDFILPPDPHFFGYIIGHEPHITGVIDSVIKPGDLCVDVGANIGYFSALIARRVGVTGQVIAFEPESGNFAVLCLNARHLGAAGFRISPHRAAISDSTENLAIRRGSFSTYHRVGPLSTQSPDQETVPAVRLDADPVLGAASREIKLIKIDVEGHEVAALRGMQGLIDSDAVRHIVIEISPESDAKELDQLLRPGRSRCLGYIDGSWQPLTSFFQVTKRIDVRVDF